MRKRDYFRRRMGIYFPNDLAKQLKEMSKYSRLYVLCEICKRIKNFAPNGAEVDGQRMSRHYGGKKPPKTTVRR